MMRFACAVLAILIASSAFAQAPPATMAFEVATIKPTDPSFDSILIDVPGGTLSARGFTLKDLIGFAYDLDDRQILGIPKMLESERYDVVGKPEKTASENEAKLMTQTLLADRFQLKFHRETREIPIYVLSVGKGGHKMKPRTEGDGGAPASMFFRGPNVPARNTSAAMLAMGLQKLVLDRPVVDKTGLTGTFDFDLTWQPGPVQLRDRTNGIGAIPDKGDIFTAIQEQLGLKLDSQRGPAVIIVVDRAEKPSSN
jgi:uncharacterized protein (TIGR03435 family)